MYNYMYVELNWQATEDAELQVLTLSREYSAQDHFIENMSVKVNCLSIP